jgi:uncharacterized membrane protein
MVRNSELRDKAYAAIEGHWGISAIITLAFFILGGTLYIPKIGAIIPILLLPVSWAYYVIFLRLIRGEEINFGQLFAGFSDQYLRYLGTLFLEFLYVALWSLLLFVPGVIKACSYAMTSYILYDEELSYDAAIEKSMVMMEGYKMKYFLMNLYFIGWAILCILTLGIGYLWLTPYIATCNAAFYEDVKKDYEARTGIGGDASAAA